MIDFLVKIEIIFIQMFILLMIHRKSRLTALPKEIDKFTWKTCQFWKVDIYTKVNNHKIITKYIIHDSNIWKL